MSLSHRRISAAFDDALHLPLNYQSRYVLFSDCHRGTGSHNDNFLAVEYLYTAALEHYYRSGFTCLELGDGDELWENRSMNKISEMHAPSFRMLARFYAEGRFYALYGNHDMIKMDPGFSHQYYRTFPCDLACHELPLCPDITFYSGIILDDAGGQKNICLIHGHQAELLNSTLWKLSRFLVRYVWRPLEKLGIPDPTSAAKNHMRKKRSEERMTEWAVKHDCILISGHTHHAMIGTPESPYCNTGSCVHPAGITCIEIENRCMTLAKWKMAARADMTLYAAKEVLGKTVCVDEYRK